MKKYGLIGKSLGYSFSKQFFNNKFANEGLDAVYSNYEIPDSSEFLEIVKDPKLVGLNVTIPYKQDVMRMMDKLSDEANHIGAVNVVKIDHINHKLIGYNTDVIGFMESIKPLLKPYHTKALVLGTGGASMAIKYGLHKLNIETLSVSRNKREGIITYKEITSELIEEYKVIVNCTPIGTFPNVNGCADIPYDLLTSNHVLYDLVYNPEETLFMKKGLINGATVKNGHEMLILQAKAAWTIWNE